MASRRGMVRRAVGRPPWNKVYEDLPDIGDRPEFGGCDVTDDLGLTPHHPWQKASARRMGGFAFAVQLHREVRPESGLVGIVEHIVVNRR